MLDIDEFYINFKKSYKFPNKTLLRFTQKPRRGLLKHVSDYVYYHKLPLLKLNLLNNEERYKRLYSILADEKSRKTLMCILKYRFTENYELLHAESDYAYNQYFDNDIIKFSDNEVFIDCGGFIGDTTGNFINRVSSFSKVYIYEPIPSQSKLTSILLSHLYPSKFDRIEIRNAGVGAEKAELKISSVGASSSISENGDNIVSVVSIDDDILERISFIKMDVEGFEINALDGAKKHIHSDHPKLAICVYHKDNDLVDIPEYILSLDNSYKLYLRQYCIGESACETVLYAV